MNRLLMNTGASAPLSALVLGGMLTVAGCLDPGAGSADAGTVADDAGAEPGGDAGAGPGGDAGTEPGGDIETEPEEDDPVPDAPTTTRPPYPDLGDNGRFQQRDSAAFLTHYDEITSYAYAAVDDEAPSRVPAGLDACRAQGPQAQQGEVVIRSATPTVLGAADVAAQCGEATRCVIGENVTLVVDGPLRLYALAVNGGAVVWNDQTQADTESWLCAGYLVVESGFWEMSLQDRHKRAWIYLMNNGATHDELRTRAFGAVSGNSHLSVVGRELRRTWSLLAEPLEPGSWSIRLMHDPIEMGWQIGDRIAVAPTESGMDDNAQAFFITGRAHDGTLYLDALSSGTSTHIANRTFIGQKNASLRAAEVINLSRNIIITGDDFEEVPCSNDLENSVNGGISTQGCLCNGSRTSCTTGLHTASEHADFSEMANVRVEKCGQRGVEGKYCLHFHHMDDCSDGQGGSSCISRNNAVEFSMHRGQIIHSTHHALVESNVFYDVRGANLYVEDGNEMLNTIAYNVGICARANNGCTLPGTSNDQADTSLNQSGIYMESPNNLMVGNRMANHFNGMFNEAGDGQGPSRGAICGSNVPIGVWEGNTFHSNGRFGTYLLNSNFPRQTTNQSVEEMGFTNATWVGNRWSHDCPAYDGAGDDMGLTSVILNHFDYGNAFVGQYDAGDIQYKRHVNVDNLNSIYWKETKTAQDGCSAHISDSYYEDGSADLPDAMGAFIIENSTFVDYGFRANHHCDVGVTGYLCMPQYVLHDIKWLDPRNTWVDFDINNGETNDGGIFTLSPDNIAAKAQGATFDIFPPDYNSVVAGNFDYLLDLPGAGCDRATDVTYDGEDVGDRYSDGILCSAPLRALKIFTHDAFDLRAADPGSRLVVAVYERDDNGNRGQLLASQVVPPVRITDDRQGFSIPVVPVISSVPRQAGPYLYRNYLYDVSLDTTNDGVGDADLDPSWVIDYSDLAVSNRWGEEFLHLEVSGRDCNDEGPDTISSYHDRRFYAAGDFDENMWGRGACGPAANKHAKMPGLSCDTLPDLTATWEGDYPYASWEAEFDARCPDCGDNGACAGRYLGGGLPALETYQCVCRPGWEGTLCDAHVAD